MPNTRLRRCAQAIDRRLSSGVWWSALASAVASLPRTLGVSCAETLTGFKPEIDDTDWVIEQVSHRFGGAGFRRRWSWRGGRAPTSPECTVLSVIARMIPYCYSVRRAKDPEEEAVGLPIGGG